MPRGEPTFRRRDLRIVVETLEKAGKHVTGARIKPDGEIIVETLPVAVDTPVQFAHKEGEGTEPDEERVRWERRLKELGC